MGKELGVSKMGWILQLVAILMGTHLSTIRKWWARDTKAKTQDDNGPSTSFCCSYFSHYILNILYLYHISPLIPSIPQHPHPLLKTSTNSTDFNDHHSHQGATPGMGTRLPPLIFSTSCPSGVFTSKSSPLIARPFSSSTKARSSWTRSWKKMWRCWGMSNPWKNIWKNMKIWRFSGMSWWFL